MACINEKGFQGQYFHMLRIFRSRWRGLPICTVQYLQVCIACSPRHWRGVVQETQKHVNVQWSDHIGPYFSSIHTEYVGVWCGTGGHWVTVLYDYTYSIMTLLSAVKNETSCGNLGGMTDEYLLSNYYVNYYGIIERNGRWKDDSEVVMRHLTVCYLLLL